MWDAASPSGSLLEAVFGRPCGTPPVRHGFLYFFYYCRIAFRALSGATGTGTVRRSNYKWWLHAIQITTSASPIACLNMFAGRSCNASRKKKTQRSLSTHEAAPSPISQFSVRLFAAAGSFVSCRSLRSIRQVPRSALRWFTGSCRTSA
jgi:hypothetical protein